MKGGLAVEALATAIFAVIIENNRVVEIRPTTLEELAAWIDAGRAEGEALTEERQDEETEK